MDRNRWHKYDRERSRAFISEGNVYTSMGKAGVKEKKVKKKLALGLPVAISFLLLFKEPFPPDAVSLSHSFH